MQNFTFPREPAVYVGIVNAIILLVVSFGLPITNEQKIAIDGLVGTVAVLLGAILVRQNVTPSIKVEEHMAVHHLEDTKTLS